VKEFYVYMMTNRSRVVLYTGVTSKLEGRGLGAQESCSERLHFKVQARSPRLLRAIFGSHLGNHARKRNQSLAAWEGK